MAPTLPAGADAAAAALGQWDARPDDEDCVESPRSAAFAAVRPARRPHDGGGNGTARPFRPPAGTFHARYSPFRLFPAGPAGPPAGPLPPPVPLGVGCGQTSHTGAWGAASGGDREPKGRSDGRIRETRDRPGEGFGTP